MAKLSDKSGWPEMPRESLAAQLAATAALKAYEKKRDEKLIRHAERSIRTAIEADPVA